MEGFLALNAEEDLLHIQCKNLSSFPCPTLPSVISLEITEGKVGHGNETVGSELGVEAGGFLSRKRSFLKEVHHI